MKTRLMKNEKYLKQKCSQMVLVYKLHQFMSRVSKSYVPFICQFPMVMHFVLVIFTSAGGQK